MKAILFLLSLTCIPLISHCRNLPFIERTCKQTPFYDLCVATLKSDPRSRTAGDPQTLALTLVDIISHKSTATLQLIQGFLKKQPELAKHLRACRRSYRAIVEADVAVATEALQKGDLKFAVDAATDAAIEADSCERGFRGKSPMTQMNKLVQQISLVTAAIVRQMM